MTMKKDNYLELSASTVTDLKTDRLRSIFLFTSPAANMNLPINSFGALGTTLVLTSDNLHLIFPPTPHRSPLLVLQTRGGTFQKLSRDAIFVVCSHTFTLF